MAHSRDPKSLTGVDNDFKCPICLEIYEQPIEIACGHSFCKECIMGCLSKISISQCPVCRTSFTTVQMKDDDTLANKIDSSTQLCTKCNTKIKLSASKQHMDVCAGTYDTDSKSSSVFKPVTPISQPKLSAIPNRATFKCPYCERSNLDRQGLIEHISENHSNDKQQVVCPICASMPWGDSDQISGNFQQHLNLRHKFDYDTFVDFNDEEEDKVLETVLRKSRKDV